MKLLMLSIQKKQKSQLLHQHLLQLQPPLKALNMKLQPFQRQLQLKIMNLKLQPHQLQPQPNQLKKVIDAVIDTPRKLNIVLMLVLLKPLLLTQNVTMKT